MSIGKMSPAGRILFLIIPIAFLLAFPVWAQKPKKIIAQADRAYFNDETRKALGLYEQALAAQPKNLKVNYRLGLIYLELNQPEKAIPVLLQATTLSSKYRPQYTLNLAKAYHLNSNFEEAIAQYQAALAKTDKKDETEILKLNKLIAECVSGQNLKANPVSAEVRILPQPLNSAFADHVPLLYNNDSSLLFTSRRGPNPNKEADENIFETGFDGESWSEPKPLPKTINSTDHDAATGISADGNTIFLYRYEEGGGISQVKRTGNTWSEPEPLPEPINSEFYEPSFYITPDNQYAFFSSDRLDGFGGLDIYLTMRQPDGTWSEAMNLGTNINSEYDDDAPFVGADGVTLYFSSRGRNSMGGYDIFKATSEGAAWTPAQNLGFPVNSPADDIYFTLAADGNRGFFSSDRVGGFGEKDLYAVTFRSAVATDSLIAGAEPEPVTPMAEPVKNLERVVLKGTVTGAANEGALNAQLVLSESKNLQEPVNTMADSTAGTYLFTVAKGGNYTLVARKEGYFYATENFSVPDDFAGDTLIKDLKLNKIKTGARLVLNNIFFETNSDQLTPESLTELENLLALMQENAGIRVEISGHTDSRGSAALNQKLSLQRAQSVIKYLEEKGIQANRMTAVGFGATKPIATNTTAEGRKQNRRTEFKVLKQ